MSTPTYYSIRVLLLTLLAVFVASATASSPEDRFTIQPTYSLTSSDLLLVSPKQPLHHLNISLIRQLQWMVSCTVWKKTRGKSNGRQSWITQ